MIKAFPLTDRQSAVFTGLFGKYYAELGCENNITHLVDEYIIPDYIAGLIKIDLLEEDGIAVGFVIYQTDDIDNDWNFKEGWGDIREIFIVPSARRKGYGKFLLFTAEMKLKESGADKAYALPCETAVAFFNACGYTKTADFCDELDCPVFEKTSLNNCCR